MADLRWAIGRYDEPGYDEWYIYDTETDMTICDSSVRKTLEVILELLAACEALVAMIDHKAEPFDWECPYCTDSYGHAEFCPFEPIEAGFRAAIAAVKGGQ